MWLRLIADIAIASTSIIGLTIGLPLNFVWWIYTFVIWDNSYDRLAYLNYLGFPNGDKTYYKMSDTFSTITGDVSTAANP